MEVNNFGVEIIDYACVGDENTYTNHLFTIRVWIDQNMYTISRTYASFCEFDAQLRRKYPRTTIQPLPLSGASAYARRASTLIKPGNTASAPDAKSAALDLRASMIGLTEDDTPSKSKPKPSVRRADKSEVISQKRTPLNGYLNSLLSLPEVLLSDNLLYFLDEESSDGQILPPQSKEVSEVDILLADEVPISKTVLRQLKIPMNLDPGSVIVWSFTTKHYDIGFSISFNEAIILPYQRYNSFTEAVSGSIQITDQGQLVLNWDNKYSKMRSKQLSFVVKVFSKDEYEAARSIASDAAKEKAQRSQQRNLLKRALASVSKGLYSISNQNGRIAPLLLTAGASSVPTGSDMPVSGVSGSEDDLQGELKRLKDEKRSLQRALSEAEAALVEERHASAGYLDRLEELVAQRDLAEKELAFLRGNNEDNMFGYGNPPRKESNTTEKMKSFGSESETLSLGAQTVDTFDDASSATGDGKLDTNILPFSANISNSNNSNNTSNKMAEQIKTLCDTIEDLKDKLSNAQEDRNAADVQLAKLKAERKALKEYAIKSKAENEQLQLVIKDQNDSIQRLQELANNQSFTIDEHTATINQLKLTIASMLESAIVASEEISSSRPLTATAAPLSLPTPPPAVPSSEMVDGSTEKASEKTEGIGASPSILREPSPMMALGAGWTSSLSAQFGSMLGIGKSASPNQVANGSVTISNKSESTPTSSPSIANTATTSSAPSTSEAVQSSGQNTTVSFVAAAQSEQQSTQPGPVSPMKKSKIAANRKSRANIPTQTLFVDDLGF